MLNIDGLVSSDYSMIKDHIIQYYEDLLSDQFAWRPKLDGLSFEAIDQSSAAWLERSFEEEEVHQVIKRCLETKHRAQMVLLWHSFRPAARWLRRML